MPLFKIATRNGHELFVTSIVVATEAAAAAEAQRALVDMMWDTPSDTPNLQFEAVVSDHDGTEIYRASLQFRSVWQNHPSMKQ
jgi:hypothetical protein